MQLWRYVAFVSVAVVVAAVSVRWGFWFMRSVPMCSWQLNSFRVDHPFEPPYDAVIVLGYAIDYRRLEPTPQLQQRLTVAANLFCDAATGKPAVPRPAPYLVLSGGLARQQSVTEAVVMARFLMKHYPLCFSVSNATATATATAQLIDTPNTVTPGETRVPLLLEAQSVSTRTNAQFSFELLVTTRNAARAAAPAPPAPEDGRGTGRSGDGSDSDALRVRVVTNPFHQYRTHRVFERVAAEQREEHMRSGFAGVEVSMHACDTPTPEATAPSATSATATAAAAAVPTSISGVAGTAVPSGAVPSAAAAPAASPTGAPPAPPPAPAPALSALINPQKDWWRECLAIAYYFVRRWI